MSTIRNTVSEALTAAGYGSYMTYAEPVIDALEEREDAIVTEIEAVAREKGLVEHEVAAIMERVGLVEPTPEPVAEVADPDNQGDLATVLAAIESLRQEVTAIKNAAARHGVHV